VGVNMEVNEVFEKVKTLFEEELEIEIDDEELTDVGTVGQAVNLLHSKL
jgi:acyl carrier protein